MDVFSTTITAGTLILQFLGACSAYSAEAKSLAARFDWDLRALKAIEDHFLQRQASNANGQLPPEDEALLERTAAYLDGFVVTVTQSLRKIERKRLMKSTFNRIMWMARRADLQDMEKELFDWTRRFDVRVLGLPPEIRTIIPATAAEDQEVEPPAVVRSNKRLQEFLALGPSSKKALANKMLLKDSTEVASKIEGRRDISFLPVQNGSEQTIFAARQIPPNIGEGTVEFQDLVSDMGELAAALNCLDPAADIKLLKVEYYFYHTPSKQFLLAHHPPYPVLSMITLETMIHEEPFPDVSAPLNQCLKLGYKLAEALFFLHTAGFIHKNITSTSVVALRRAREETDDLPDEAIDETYLMGFDLVRADTARTTKEGAVRDTKTPRSIWEFDIFQHPDRLRGVDSPRYIKTYDVYSLGVVLLEIGFWKPIPDIVEELNQGNPSSWPKALSGTMEAMSARTGEKYQRIVAWCLDLKGDQIVKDSEFMEKVLDPLEELIGALS
jgi:hypothetical protein